MGNTASLLYCTQVGETVLHEKTTLKCPVTTFTREVFAYLHMRIIPVTLGFQSVAAAKLSPDQDPVFSLCHAFSTHLCFAFGMLSLLPLFILFSMSFYTLYLLLDHCRLIKCCHITLKDKENC